MMRGLVVVVLLAAGYFALKYQTHRHWEQLAATNACFTPAVERMRNAAEARRDQWQQTATTVTDDGSNYAAKDYRAAEDTRLAGDEIQREAAAYCAGTTRRR